jgi:selT/selW/selH-like putative selenoprotein
LAADLKEFGVVDRINLLPGDNGIFKVTLDDKLIYSKTRSGNFPNSSEIADIARMINS